MTFAKRLDLKRLAVVCAVACASVLLAFALAACSNSGGSSDESKMKAAFEGISSDTGIHMKFSMDDAENGNTEMELFRKDSNLYATMVDSVDNMIIISDGELLTMLYPDTMTGEQLTIDDQVQGVLDTITAGFDSVLNMRDSNRPFTPGKMTIDGKEYETEEYTSGDNKATMAFDENGKLAYMISDTTADGSEATIKIEALDGNVPEGQFDIPAGYTVRKEDGSTISTG